MRPCALLLAALAAATAQAAGVYKWVDRNGVVHYDDTQVVYSQRMTREYMDQRQIAADPGWTGPVPGAFVEEVEKQCSNNRERLGNYQNAKQLFGRDPSGNSYPLTPRQVALMVAETERDAKRYCQPDAARKLYIEKMAAASKPRPVKPRR